MNSMLTSGFRLPYKILKEEERCNTALALGHWLGSLFGRWADFALQKATRIKGEFVLIFLRFKRV